jgi:hypothetical protein
MNNTPVHAVKARKGMVIALMVVIIAMMNVLVLGVVSAGAMSSTSDIARLETARAVFAADAGAMVAMRQASLGKACPTNGTVVTLPGGGRVVWISSPAVGSDGTVRIDGMNASAIRRVSIAYTID